MTSAPLLPMQFPTPSREEENDPLLARQSFEYRKLFYPLGFVVELETNSMEILMAAEESWGEQSAVAVASQSEATLKVRLGATSSSSVACPPRTTVRANGHLLSIMADTENFVMCDLQQGVAFGWVCEAALCYRGYLRYHFLEAAVMCLLSGSRMTPIHAACVSLNGRGLLLCGPSGVGKSTLAYACARAGWTFTTDDASYLVWHRDKPYVRGNAHQVRFRPSARLLFPEIGDRSLTPRTEGKPSIEIRTAELPGIATATEAAVHAILLLRRHDRDTTELKPLPREAAFAHFEASLYPLEGVRQRQAAALDNLRHAPIYEFSYRDLDIAIARLASCTQAMTKR